MGRSTVMEKSISLLTIRKKLSIASNENLCTKTLNNLKTYTKFQFQNYFFIFLLLNIIIDIYDCYKHLNTTLNFFTAILLAVFFSLTYLLVYLKVYNFRYCCCFYVYLKDYFLVGIFVQFGPQNNSLCATMMTN